MGYIIRLGNWYVQSWNKKFETVVLTANIHSAQIFNTKEKDIAFRFIMAGGLNPKTVEIKND